MFNRTSIQPEDNQHPELLSLPHSKILSADGVDNDERGIALTNCRLSWSDRKMIKLFSGDDTLELEGPTVVGMTSATNLPSILMFDHFEEPIWESLIGNYDPNIRSVKPFGTTVGIIYRIDAALNKIVTALATTGFHCDIEDPDTAIIKISTQAEADALLASLAPE